ncbi:MAG: hypothetical protein K6B64_06015 [Acholeplasmatales bacterium]|nr:hypothetical protein [Acholeplasmatales bacterium]
MNNVENNPKLDIYKKQSKRRFIVYISIEIAIFLGAIISFILFAVFYNKTIYMVIYSEIAVAIANGALCLFLPIRDFIEKRMIYDERPFRKKYVIYLYGYICTIVLLAFLWISIYAFPSIITPDFFFICWLIYLILYVVGTMITAFIINWNYNPKVLFYRYKKERKKENE